MCSLNPWFNHSMSRHRFPWQCRIRSVFNFTVHSYHLERSWFRNTIPRELHLLQAKPCLSSKGFSLSLQSERPSVSPILLVDCFLCISSIAMLGTYGGSLKNMSATDLAEVSSRAALKSASISPEYIDHVIIGMWANRE